MTKQNKKIFLIVGEASGDILASSIMSKIQAKETVQFLGIGGEEMQRIKGFKSILDIKDFSILGLIEVLKHYRTLNRKINIVVNEIIKTKPSMILSVDAPSLAKTIILRAKKRGYKGKCIHVVAPQVWAWRSGRAKKYSKIFDRILCFFKFEEPFFTKYGGKIETIGHPAIERYHGSKQDFIKKYPFAEGKKIIALLPGSRINEVNFMLKEMQNAIEILNNLHKNICFFLPLVENTESRVKETIKEWNVKPALIKGTKERYDLFAAADVAICASGTVSLELSIRKCPTIACYKFNWLTYFIAKNFVKVKYLSLINILNDKQIIPELLQEELTDENIILETNKMLKKGFKEKYQKDMNEYLKPLKPGAGNPSVRATTIILKALNVK